MDADVPSKTDDSPEILLVTASVGAGHDGAAAAVEAELKSRPGAPSVGTVDILDFVPWWYKQFYAGGYHFGVEYTPTVYGICYALSDLHNGTTPAITERMKYQRERFMQRRFLEYLQQHPPRLIVHTHFLAPQAIAAWKRMGRIDTRQMIVTTDVEVHRWWYCSDAEHWFASRPPVKDRLMKWGIDENRITVSGMPVHPKWTAPTASRHEILSRWSLHPDRRIVLLSGGTNFTCGPIARIARRLVAACDDITVVVAAGRNKGLLGHLSRLSETRAGRIVPTGFTDKIHELVEVASLMVTKPGGMITTECITRSTPMVFISPVPGQEGLNARYYAQNGAAVVTRSTRHIARTVREILGDETRLEEMTQAAEKLILPGSAAIADHILASI